MPTRGACARQGPAKDETTNKVTRCWHAALVMLEDLRTTALQMVLISLRKTRAGTALMALPRSWEGAKAARAAALPERAATPAVGIAH